MLWYFIFVNLFLIVLGFVDILSFNDFRMDFGVLSDVINFCVRCIDLVGKKL